MLRTIALLLLVACNGEKQSTPPTGDDDDDTTPLACADDAGCTAGREICDAGACIPGDRDNAFEEATPLFQGDDNALTGWIYPAEDVDYYVYTTAGPEWVSVRTIVDEDSELDTVVHIFGPNGALHAVMDDYPVWPFGVSGFDTVLYAYLPSAGTWFISVEDQTTYDDTLTPSGRRSWSYDVLVRPANGIGEPDSAQNPGVSVDLVDGNTVSVVGVVVGQPGDTDYVSVSFPFDDRLLEVWGQPGISGSSANPLVRIVDGGIVVAEKEGLGEAGWLSWFYAHSGTFTVQATDADGAGADDAWFPLYFRTYDAEDSHPFFGTNVYERETEPNNDPPNAIALTPTEDGNGTTAYRLQGEVNVVFDTDWFTVEAAANEQITVRCWTDRFGSLASLAVGVSADGTDFTPAGQGEKGQDDFYIDDVPVPRAGTIHLRVSSIGPGAGGAHWYRCAAFVQ